jgi:hypothetical protein
MRSSELGHSRHEFCTKHKVYVRLGNKRDLGRRVPHFLDRLLPSAAFATTDNAS